MKKKYKIFLSLIFVVIVGIASVLGLSVYYGDDLVDEVVDKVIPTPKEVWPKEYSMSLLATGDTVIHSGIYKAAKTSDGYDFNYMLDEVRDIVPNYDISYINVEAPFMEGEPVNYPRFNAPSQWGDAMINAGFNMYSLANNHSYDMFEQGVIDSLTYWNSQENVIFDGMNSSYEEQDEIVIQEKNGITYAFLAYTEHTNGLKVPEDKSYLVDVYSKELAQKHIDSIKDSVDVIIVSMHWGPEYKENPSDAQVTMATELADMGVDIILGNHPHWIQPIAKINDCLVIYSMGNFISNQKYIADSYPYTWSVTIGAFVMMDINKTVYEDGTSNILVDNITVELLYSHHNYKVIPFSKMNSSIKSNYVSLYEEHKTRITSMMDGITVNPYGT